MQHLVQHAEGVNSIGDFRSTLVRVNQMCKTARSLHAHKYRGIATALGQKNLAQPQCMGEALFVVILADDMLRNAIQSAS